jgi:uncharacterized membrane protein HdeD (DUF308 family)
MSSITGDRIVGMLAEEANSIRKNWGWFVALGIVQVVVGILAVSFAFSATLASVMTIGILLLVSAGVQSAAAIWARDWSGFFLLLLLSVLYGIAGFLTLVHPLAAAESVTLLLAAIFLIAGTYRIVAAIVQRFESWGWVLLNGVITVLLGFLILQQWPGSSLWVLGTLVGVDLIVNGVTLCALALGARNVVATVSGR